MTLTTLAASANDWRVYRHDVSLSGVSPGKGNIVTPHLKWEYYLGAPFVTVAADRNYQPSNVADLDGDGTPERFHLSGKTIEVTDLNSKPLWSFTVSGHPLGGNVRVCQLLPDRKGKQIISFSHRMDTGEGQGYCFAFDKGARNGALVWTTGPLTAHYAPTLIVDDVDGDGLQEIVTAPHYRVQIFNGQTGALKAEVPVAKGRNYGILLSRPRRDRPQKDIYIISDFVLHVECVRFENGKWVHAWGHKYLEDENAPRPQGRLEYIRVGPYPVSDLDGDGKDEMAYMFVDGAVDDQWHLIVRDGETGKVKADISGVWLWSIADLDGDGTAELLYTPTKEKRPPTYCDLHVGRLTGDTPPSRRAERSHLQRRGWLRSARNDSALRMTDLAVLKRVRPILMNATLPLTADTIADEGLQDILRADVDGDGKPEFFYAEKSKSGRFEDMLCAASLTPDGSLKRTWQFARRGHRLNLIFAGMEAHPSRRAQRSHPL
ncbi:MAG: VCBS repeat-containing protein, partial [Abditibacteriales bacterium]|nr:VCBS repeat-containing protein [Abditibacteriales bacterium]